MEVGVCNGVEEERVVDAFKCLAYVDGDRCCTMRRFPFIEARCNAHDEREERRRGRMSGAEAMLRWRESERSTQAREETPLKYL